MAVFSECKVFCGGGGQVLLNIIYSFIQVVRPRHLIIDRGLILPDLEYILTCVLPGVAETSTT